MGFLDKLFGKKEPVSQEPPASFWRRYPSRSIVNEADLRSVADFDRYYPLPPGFQYRQRGQSRPAISAPNSARIPLLFQREH